MTGHRSGPTAGRSHAENVTFHARGAMESREGVEDQRKDARSSGIGRAHRARCRALRSLRRLPIDMSARDLHDLINRTGALLVGLDNQRRHAGTHFLGH